MASMNTYIATYIDITLQIHSIIIMNQSYEQEQQCFIPAQDEHEDSTPQGYSNQLDALQWTSLIGSVIPSANQLRYKDLPTDLTPRTCFLELQMKMFPRILLNANKQQFVSEVDEQPIKIKNPIKNQYAKTIQQYFTNQQFKVVYDRISKYASMRFSMKQMMNRFKNISLYQEYHEKMFINLSGKDESEGKAGHVLDDDNFDSNFECGNLGKVYVKHQQQSRQYYLLLQNDINAHGYASWFFFKVISCGSGTVKFNILNLVKTPSMYKNGMKISIFSMNKWRKQQIGWFKGGDNISAYQNNFPKQFRDNGYYSSLCFQYNFKQQEEQVYFAMSQPYPYSRLSQFISIKYPTIQPNKSYKQYEQHQQTYNIIEQPEQDDNNSVRIRINSEQIQNSIINEEQLHYQVKKQIYTICNNIIPIIQIWKGQLEKDKRKAIIFMGRQHPAEVVGSFIIQQVMKYFSLSDENIISEILEKYLIIFIPMVNPDGVIHGNSRCNFAGLDLNRQWMKQSIKEVTPQTSSLRKYIWGFHQRNGIQFMIDLHGHSKKMGSFAFCSKTSQKNPPWYFPMIVSQIQPRFDLNSCTYNTTPDKKNTLRNQLYEQGMKNWYHRQGTPKIYTDSDFVSLAQSVVKSLHFVLFQEKQAKYTQLLNNVLISRQNLYKNFSELNKKNNLGRSSLPTAQQNDLQSDSEPEEGILKPEQMKKIFTLSDSSTKIKKKNANNNTNIVENTKIRSRKQKTLIRIPQQKKKQQDEQDIRKSYPFQNQVEKREFQKHSYRSEKKIHPINTTKRINDSSNKKSKPESAAHNSHSRNTNETSEKKVTTHQLKIKSQISKKNHGTYNNPTKKCKGTVVTVFTNYPLSQMNAGRIKKKKQQIYKSILTQIQDDIPSIKDKKQFLDKINQKQIKGFLDETLSILRINGMNPQTKQLREQEERNTQHQVFQKMLRSGMRVKTQGQYLSVTGKQQQGNKKTMGRNYRKQILKRKKMLKDKEQNMKFNRFQNFRDTSYSMKKQLKGTKLQENSVFYHFPIL